MKAFSFCIAFFLAIGALLRAEEGPFIVAVKDQKDVRCNSAMGWYLEKGEVYRFVRYMSRAEYSGRVPQANDNTYAVVQMQNLLVVAPSNVFALVQSKDSALAAIIYAKQLRTSEAPAESQNIKEMESALLAEVFKSMGSRGK